MSAVLTLDMIGSAKPLARCGMAELAVHTATARPSGGILFARGQERGHKDEARRYIIDLLGDVERYPRLSVLTMPGMSWRFENKLLGRREGDWANGASGPRRTAITAAESDRSIYFAAVTKMPGMIRDDWRTRGRLVPAEVPNPVVSMETPPAWAECSVSNPWVERFHFANVDDLLASGDCCYDAAWLDYTGPLSVTRLAVIQRFWQQRIRPGGALALTVLKARWQRPASQAMAAGGGHHEWVVRNLPGDVHHVCEYQDTGSPMYQIIVTKP